MPNLSALLEGSATRFADRDAVVLGDLRLTYAQVDGAANQVANLLASRGIGPGDNVALTCPNLPDFPIVYYGILKTGAAVVPLNVMLTDREIAYHLADSNAKAYFCFEGTPPKKMGQAGRDAFEQTPGCEHFFLITADPDADFPIEGTATLDAALADQPWDFDTHQAADEDTAIVLYTSGTTGQPKGAELTHANMTSNALAGRELFGCDAERPDTYLGVLPLFHSFGQTVVLNSCFAFGGTLVLLPRFDPVSALDLLEKGQVTFFAGVPTMYWSLLGTVDDSVDLSSLARNLRVAASGGSALPVEVHKDFREKFGVTILEGYGLSETSPVAAFSVYGENPRVGSIGVPIPGVEMKLIKPDWSEVDHSADPDAVGEIAIKGPNVMKGYYDRPAATAEAIQDGWFRTGDLARRDTDGFYYIVDRAKDMIIRGGYNVYPREIEEVLMTHPAVSLAAVIGVPHESHGEEVKAFVIPEKGADVTPEELLAWSKEQFAAYKYPREIEIAGTLPMTATGKILKRELG